MAGPLRELDVLVVDCQATAAAPRGHLIELGWAHVGTAPADPHALLIQLPDGTRIPPAVSRITGITSTMMRTAVNAQGAWGELEAQAARLAQQPAPTVAHFARFERPFLCALAGGTPRLDIVCTHEIARRLLPQLPRRSLRALTGYFGRGVGTLRRSADHVEATAFVWRELVRLLEAEGIATWHELKEWLSAPGTAPKVARRVWPMPRTVRLAVPDSPGLYRMLRTSGDVLYVGKASSLRHRVNSYFRKQHGVHERLLEMLSQARGLSFEIAPSALEAALLEPDEIKRHRPPYNIALAADDRRLWFAARDLSARSAHSSALTPVGPFPSGELLDQIACFARGSREALGRGRWAPDASVFEAGCARLRALHPEMTSDVMRADRRLLRLGTRLWREGRRDREEEGEDDLRRGMPASEWTADHVQTALERLALRAALARRRARWLTRLADASIVWNERGVERARLLVIDNGEIVAREDVARRSLPPVPPGHARTMAARREAFTIASFDRLRVLLTELKRLSCDRSPVSVRFGSGPPLSDARLARVLSWL